MEQQLFEQIMAKLNEIEKSNKQISAKIDEVYTVLSKRIDEVESKLTTRIDQVEAEMHKEYNSLLKRMDDMYKMLDEKTNKISRQLAIVTADVKELKDENNSLWKDFENLENKVYKIADATKVSI